MMHSQQRGSHGNVLSRKICVQLDVGAQREEKNRKGVGLIVLIRYIPEGRYAKLCGTIAPHAQRCAVPVISQILLPASPQAVPKFWWKIACLARASTAKSAPEDTRRPRSRYHDHS